MIARTDDVSQKLQLPDQRVVSGNASKMYHYGLESYYQESSHDLSVGLQAPVSTYSDFTFVLLKPDAFVGRAGTRIISVLESHGFSAVGSMPFEFDRFMWRELWRYELNVARVQRYPLIDELLCNGPSLFVLLRDTAVAQEASVRLTQIKGNTNQRLRNATHLRSQIGAKAGTLNFIHCPDEFIDFVRELGVLFDSSGRQRVAAMMDGERPSALVTEQIASLETHYPSHPLELNALVDRLGEEFSGAINSDKETLRTDPYQLRDAYCDRFGLSRWDWITIAANFLEYSHAGMRGVFDCETQT